MSAIQLGDQGEAEILLPLRLEIEEICAQCPGGRFGVGHPELAENRFGICHELLEQGVFHAAPLPSR